MIIASWNAIPYIKRRRSADPALLGPKSIRPQQGVSF